MAFDKDQDPDEPLVRPEKRTTKVNIGVVISVIIFICLGLLALCTFSVDPPTEAPQILPDRAPAR